MSHTRGETSRRYVAWSVSVLLDNESTLVPYNGMARFASGAMGAVARPIAY